MPLAVCLLCWCAVAQGVQSPVTAIGRVRLGGVGTGWIEWRGADGFGSSALTYNHAAPAPPSPGSFLAVWTRAQGRASARVLGTSSPYGLPCSRPPATEHRFPFAYVRYLDEDLPVVVSARLFAPVIPNDVSASSTPAVVVTVTVRNVSRAPVEAAILASFETVLGIGGGVGLERFDNRRNIETTTLPVSGGMAGVTFSGPALNDTPVADLRMHNARGTQSLLVMSPSPEAEVTTCTWNPSTAKPHWWEAFAANGSVAPAAGARGADQGELAGAVAVKVALEANETRDIPFAIAWHSPRIYDRHSTDSSPPYVARFRDAVTVARHVLEDRAALETLSAEWQVRLLRSVAGAAALPKLAAALETAISSTQWTCFDGKSPPAIAFVDLEAAGPDGLLAWEPRVRIQDALLALFPALDAADIEGRLASTAARDLLREPEDRLALDVIRLVHRHVWRTSNRAWLSAIWPRLRTIGLPSMERMSQKGLLDAPTVTAMLDLASMANDNTAAARCAELRAVARAGTAAQPGPSAWEDWVTLVGCTWDVAANELTLRPRMLPSQARFSGPVFLPGHWAWCEWRQLPARTTAEFRLDRVVPMSGTSRVSVQSSSPTGPLEIRRIVLHPPRRQPRAQVRVVVRSSPTAFTAQHQADGSVTITLDPAVTIAPGDRIAVELTSDSED